MDLRHLRYFSAVADAGSIARASAQLRVAQPAVSRQIQDFEAGLGHALFERTAQGMLLTLAGATLLPRARDLLAALDLAISETVRADAGTLGEVRVALSPFAVASERVGATLAGIQESHPDIVFGISDLVTEMQTHALKAGDLDVGIGFDGVDDPELRDVPLYAVSVNCAILSETHPLAGSPSVSIEALRGEPLLSVGRSMMRSVPRVLAEVEARGLQVDDAHESIESVFWHVAAGKGWALGIASQRRQAPPPGTVVVPLSDFDVDTFMVARARVCDQSRTTAQVIDSLRKAFGKRPSRPVHDLKTPIPAPASRGVELRHLEALIAVGEERSLSRAAERLGLTQSGVSRRIVSLEETLDVQLLERGNSSVLPTPAARVLARHAASIIREWQQIVHTPGPGSARCRLAIVSTRVNESVVLEVLHSLGRDAFEVSEMLSPAVEDAVREGRADVGVSNAYARVEDPGIATMVLIDDAIECALLPASHPLAGSRSIRAAQLASEPFLFFARHDTPKLYDLVLDELEQAGFRPKVATTVTTPRAIRSMIAASMGWSLTLRSQVTQPLPGLVAVPIEGLHIWAGAQLMWRSNERNARILAVVRAFREWKGVARSA